MSKVTLVFEAETSAELNAKIREEAQVRGLLGGQVVSTISPTAGAAATPAAAPKAAKTSAKAAPAAVAKPAAPPSAPKEEEEVDPFADEGDEASQEPLTREKVLGKLQDVSKARDVKAVKAILKEVGIEKTKEIQEEHFEKIVTACDVALAQ